MLDPRSSSRSFSFAVGRALGTVVVTLHGSLGLAEAAQIAHVLGDLIDDQGNRALVVDVGDLSGFDPAALYVLATIDLQDRRRGAELVLAHPSSALRAALEHNGAEPSPPLRLVTNSRVWSTNGHPAGIGGAHH